MMGVLSGCKLLLPAEDELLLLVSDGVMEVLSEAELCTQAQAVLQHSHLAIGDGGQGGGQGGGQSGGQHGGRGESLYHSHPRAAIALGDLSPGAQNEAHGLGVEGQAGSSCTAEGFCSEQGPTTQALCTVPGAAGTAGTAGAAEIAGKVGAAVAAGGAGTAGAAGAAGTASTAGAAGAAGGSGWRAVLMQQVAEHIVHSAHSGGSGDNLAVSGILAVRVYPRVASSMYPWAHLQSVLYFCKNPTGDRSFRGKTAGTSSHQLFEGLR